MLHSKAEIAIVDAMLPDMDVLVRMMRPEVSVRMVGAGDSGLEAFRDALAERPAAIHVVAHGSPGRVALGRDGIDADRIGAIEPLRCGTEVSLYACRAAAGPQGHRLLSAIDRLTGAGVAGASRDVGEATLGGTWALGMSLGVYRAKPLLYHDAVAAWPQTLATYPGTDGNDYYTGTSSADSMSGQMRNDFLSGDGGNDTIDGTNVWHMPPCFIAQNAVDWKYHLFTSGRADCRRRSLLYGHTVSRCRWI